MNVNNKYEVLCEIANVAINNKSNKSQIKSIIALSDNNCELLFKLANQKINSLYYVFDDKRKDTATDIAKILNKWIFDYIAPTRFEYSKKSINVLASILMTDFESLIELFINNENNCNDEQINRILLNNVYKLCS